MPVEWKQTKNLGDGWRYWFRSGYYGATIGKFQTADAVVLTFANGGPKDARTLSRYAYVLNTPLRAVDPSGHEALVDPGWAGRFASAHGGQAPSQQDWRDYQFSLGHAGSGPNGTWTGADWALFTAIQGRVGFGLTGLAWPLVVGGNGWSPRRWRTRPGRQRRCAMPACPSGRRTTPR